MITSHFEEFIFQESIERLSAVSPALKSKIEDTPPVEQDEELLEGCVSRDGGRPSPVLPCRAAVGSG